MSTELRKQFSSSSSQKSIPEDLVCDICPHNCSILPNFVGRCGIIRNESSSLVNAYAGRFSNIAIEPIEKRPFFHVLPGSKFLSVGFYGCLLKCKFCENHRISQQVTGKFKFYSPIELVQLAMERNVQGIAFTYNEPVLYHDYIEEVGHEIGRSKLSSHLKLTIKTSGFVRPWVIRNICLYADAINVDIKGDDQDYDKICGGWLDPVMACIERIIDMEVHLEISYLVLPSKIHDDRFNIYFRNWLADVDPEIPLHLLYFYPFHRMVVPTYKPSELLSLREMMLEKLDYVYISNYFGSRTSATRNTVCWKCGKTVITRQKGSVISHVCCGVKLPGVFADK